MKTDFAQTIPKFDDFQATLNPQAYIELPEGWTVIITDVKNSTLAIQQGRYRDVNAIGGSTIAAVLNAVKPLAVPYVFGGDGASFCVPPEVLPKVKQALRGCQELAHDGLGLELRVGLIPYAQLLQKILICRFQRAENLTQFFFIGGGMEEAELKTKQNPQYQLPTEIEAQADFSGFECRWNQVPGNQEVTFSLLVKSRLESDAESLELYRSLIQQIATLLGGGEHHHPLNLKGLSLSFNAQKLKAEIMTKSLKQGWIKQLLTGLKIRLENIIGSYWMKHRKRIKRAEWGNYKTDLIANSDYEKLDDMYRTVMTADHQSLQRLLAWLEHAYQQGKLYYGCHQTHSAVITCLISQTGVQHVHFVDSAEGGYAMAAKQMKAQMQTANSNAG